MGTLARNRWHRNHSGQQSDISHLVGATGGTSIVSPSEPHESGSLRAKSRFCGNWQRMAGTIGPFWGSNNGMFCSKRAKWFESANDWPRNLQHVRIVGRGLAARKMIGGGLLYCKSIHARDLRFHYRFLTKWSDHEQAVRSLPHVVGYSP